MAKKYSVNFERDFNWYLSMRNTFDFDGQLYRTDIVYDKDGVDAKRAFFLLDSQGKMTPTKHPTMLRQLIKVKGGTNLHIAMYAEDRASGILPSIEFDEWCDEWKVPKWFIEAVERQTHKIRKTMT